MLPKKLASEDQNIKWKDLKHFKIGGILNTMDFKK